MPASTIGRVTSDGPGRRVPARLALALLLATVPVAPVLAQAPPPASRQPVPSELELAKLIWSTLAMIEHANRSGNYSVLRDTSANGFQIANDPARLASIFAALRATGIDLSNSLLVAPTYLGPPAQLQPEVFQVRGFFPLRPTGIFFDLTFQWEQGRWKLFGVTVEPRAMVNPQAATPAPAAAPSRPAPAARNTGSTLDRRRRN